MKGRDLRRLIDTRYSPEQPHDAGGKFAATTTHHKGGKTTSVDQEHPPGQAQPAPPVIQVPPGLSAEEAQAVQAWLGQWHEAIAAEAAADTPGPYFTIIHLLDEAIRRARALTGDQVVYRGLPPAGQGGLLHPHSIVRAAGFLDCSTVPLPPTLRALEITIPRGTRALALPGSLLLARGSHLRIELVPANGNIRATLLPVGAPPREKRGDEALARYRALWMRSRSPEERMALLQAVERHKAGRTPA